ncbi:MAG: NAD-dependent dehydratase, partial [bacterium]
PINIGSGQQTSINKIAELIGGEITNLPARDGEMRLVQADTNRAKELLGWESSISLAEGLKKLKKEWDIQE